MAKVTLKNVCKTYDDNVEAVNNFNLEVGDTEFVIFVGPSGCGKSTTLRMIAGLEEISSGELYIGEKLSNNVPPKDRDIAMVFQNYALYPHMSVFDNMAFGLKLRKIPKEEIKKRVNEAAEILGISHLLNRKPKALSGGQRQRVALGRAIVRHPKVFLLDEPLSNLDAKLRTQMRTEISKLHQRLKTTFIYVTHDQTEAMTMGDRIVVMKDGNIQQIDSPKNLYEKPCNEFVAGFIGTPPMNFIEAKLIKKNNKFVLSFDKFEIELPEEKNANGVLQNYLNQNVVFGIRPGALYIKENKPTNKILGSFKAEVELTESMGSEVYLYLTVNGKAIIARVRSDTTAKPYECLDVYMDVSRIHIFDKNTGKTITN